MVSRDTLCSPLPLLMVLGDGETAGKTGARGATNKEAYTATKGAQEEKFHCGRRRRRRPPAQIGKPSESRYHCYFTLRTAYERVQIERTRLPPTRHTYICKNGTPTCIYTEIKVYLAARQMRKLHSRGIIAITRPRLSFIATSLVPVPPFDSRRSPFYFAKETSPVPDVNSRLLPAQLINVRLREDKPG